MSLVPRETPNLTFCISKKSINVSLTLKRVERLTFQFNSLKMCLFIEQKVPNSKGENGEKNSYKDWLEKTQKLFLNCHSV